MIRTHTLKYIAEDLKPISEDYYFRQDSVPALISSDSIQYRLSTDSALIVVETYRWYSKGYRYPVFETVHSWVEVQDSSDDEYFRTAFFFPPQDHYYLEEDEENLAILLNEENDINSPSYWADLSYNFYPNPVQTDLEVEFFMPHAGRVRMHLIDKMGQAVWHREFG